MDSLFLILLLLVLALVIGSILGWVAFLRTSELRLEIRSLSGEVAQLRSAIGGDRPATAASAAAVDTGEPIAPAPEETPVPPASSATEQSAQRPGKPFISGPYGVQPEAPPTPSTDAARQPPPPLPAAPEAPRHRDLEEAIGTRWTVWVGGLALALGGIFLVRYSIESGLLGPTARTLLGLLFAAALMASGEWLRRREAVEPAPDLRRAYIPGILTAAGTVTAFGSVYAAYALYGLIGSFVAILALSAVALGTLALAIVHGPGLAGLGLATSYASPLLIPTDTPNFAALVVYLTVVSVASLRIAWLKGWRWLAIAATIGNMLWALLMAATSSYPGFDEPVVALHIALSLVSAVITFAAGIHPRDPGRVAPLDKVGTALLVAFTVPVVAHLLFFGIDTFGLALVLGLAATIMVVAYEWPAFRLGPLFVPPIVWFGYLALLVPEATVDPTILNSPVLPPVVPSPVLFSGGAITVLFTGLGLFGVLGSASRIQQAIASVLVALGIFVLAYLRVTEFTISFSFGVAALALAFFFAAVVEALIRRLPPDEYGVDPAIATFAVGSVAALAFGLAAMLEKGFLTVALAAVVPAIAWVEAGRPVRGLRPIAVAVALLVAARFVWDPAVVGTDLGATPVFNWLLYGYGGPALAFGFAAWRFAATRQDRFVPIFEALAVIFTTLTVVMLIHHAMNGGNIYAPVSGLAEQSLVTMSLLAVSLGLQWLAVRRPSTVFSKGTLVLGGLGLVMAGAGLLFVHNPVFTGEPIDGGAFDGTLLLGYLLPSIMAFAVALLARRRPDRPGWYVALAAWLGGALAFVWVTLAVRAAFHQGDLSGPPLDEAELYAYSAIWLLCGLVVLGTGIVTRSRAVRLVSAVIVVGVVAKVFLVDTAGLTGALRALSFIGLGAVLVLVGLGYQKVLRRTA
ncbi:DUF2339 domain-containing protein [Chthonobacter albigriseus]|uniref:DUF2339 domain-containing protein n=1 Tax=Chthonobacter albigriseus TaxID=1683161 RepID=UPI0015EFD33D|nr:DUF2339 domain-containing protein [Chthonobacter albigriseus]